MNEQLGYAIFAGRHGEQYAIEYSEGQIELGMVIELTRILRARQITEYQDFSPTTSSSDADIKEFIYGEEEAETLAVGENLDAAFQEEMHLPNTGWR